jgi:hypothetical protein
MDCWSWAIEQLTNESYKGKANYRASCLAHFNPSITCVNSSEAVVMMGLTGVFASSLKIRDSNGTPVSDFPWGNFSIRASLGTLISYGIFIFPMENELISLGKMKIPWEISVPKLALIGC